MLGAPFPTFNPAILRLQSSNAKIMQPAPKKKLERAQRR
jgi:hypothetical protein